MNVFRFFFRLLLRSPFLTTCDLISSDSDSDKKYYLSTTASPDEAGVVTPTGGAFSEGEMITLQAEANEDWVFLHLDGKRFFGIYWSSRNLSPGMSSRRRFYHDSDHASRWELNKRNGYSVRCLKE